LRKQELLVKQYKTEATDKAVDKLAKKMGADKIIKQFQRSRNKTVRRREGKCIDISLTKKKPKDQELHYYELLNEIRYRSDELTSVQIAMTS
jgi:ribosomal protein L30E